MKNLAIVVALALAVLCLTGMSWDRSILGPYAGGTNTADDYEGTVDTRAGTWGKSGYAIHKITFKPPSGYRTRVLHVEGSFHASPRVTGGEGEILNPRGYSGVLFGIQTTAQEGSTRADLMGDNCLFYIQGMLDSRPFNMPISADIRANGLLEPDNVLVLKTATFLNTIGVAIHMEPSLVVTYQFERLSL